MWCMAVCCGVTYCLVWRLAVCCEATYCLVWCLAVCCDATYCLVWCLAVCCEATYCLMWCVCPVSLCLCVRCVCVSCLFVVVCLSSPSEFTCLCAQHTRRMMITIHKVKDQPRRRHVAGRRPSVRVRSGSPVRRRAELGLTRGFAADQTRAETYGDLYLLFSWRARACPCEDLYHTEP